MSATEPPADPERVSLQAALAGLVPAVVHRLNNSLAVVRGVLDLLARDRGEHILQRAIEESIAAAELLRQLSLFSKTHPLQVAWIDPALVAREAANLLGPVAKAKGVLLEEDVSTRVAVVEADPTSLFQTLVMAGSCLIDQAAQRGPRPRVRLSMRASRNRVRLRLTAALPDPRLGKERIAGLLAGCAPGAGDEGPGPEGHLRTGVPVRTRIVEIGRVVGLCLSLPARIEEASAARTEMRPEKRSLLYVGSGDTSDDELVALLVESGFDVRRAPAGADPVGKVCEQAVDLALVDSRLVDDRPDCIPELERAVRSRSTRVILLGASTGDGAFPRLRWPCPPGQLLAFVACVLAE